MVEEVGELVAVLVKVPVTIREKSNGKSPSNNTSSLHYTSLTARDVNMCLHTPVTQYAGWGDPGLCYPGNPG